MNQIRDRVWSGEINVMIKLHPNDSNDMSTQRSYFTTFKRNSYFPIHFQPILDFFKPYILVPHWSESSEWWLEFEDVPLKWNWPIGLLYDYLTGPSRQHDEVIDTWTLTLRHRDYPLDYLLPLESSNSIEDMWVNQIKESCFVYNGSSKAIMNLSKESSSSLWQSVREHNQGTYTSILSKVLPSPSNMKKIPVKLYLPGSNTVIQKPVNVNMTLKDMLNELLPDLFPRDDDYSIAKPLIHGIVPNSDLPLKEFFLCSMYIDCFLHVCVLMVT